MEEFQNISKFDIEDKLTGESYKTTKTIALAIMIGPFLFLLVLLFLYQENMGSSPQSNIGDRIEIMLIVFLFIAAIHYAAVFLLPKFYLKKENLVKKLAEPALTKKDVYSSDPVIKLIGVDRTFMILRLALMEGITLFGLVILFMSIADYSIYANSHYWILVLPWLIQFIFTFNNYLSKEKVLDRIYNEILQKVLT